MIKKVHAINQVVSDLIEPQIETDRLVASSNEHSHGAEEGGDPRDTIRVGTHPNSQKLTNNTIEKHVTIIINMT